MSAFRSRVPSSQAHDRGPGEGLRDGGDAEARTVRVYRQPLGDVRVAEAPHEGGALRVDDRDGGAGDIEGVQLTVDKAFQPRCARGCRTECSCRPLFRCRGRGSGVFRGSARWAAPGVSSAAPSSTHVSVRSILGPDDGSRRAKASLSVSTRRWLVRVGLRRRRTGGCRVSRSRCAIELMLGGAAAAIQGEALQE